MPARDHVGAASAVERPPAVSAGAASGRRDSCRRTTKWDIRLVFERPATAAARVPPPVPDFYCGAARRFVRPSAVTVEDSAWYRTDRRFACVRQYLVAQACSDQEAPTISTGGLCRQADAVKELADHGAHLDARRTDEPYF